MVNLCNNTLIDSYIMSYLMFLRIVRVDCMSHISRNKEGSLDCSFEIIEWYLARFSQKLIDSVE